MLARLNLLDLSYGDSETRRRQEVLTGGQQDIEMGDDDDSFDEDPRGPRVRGAPRERRDHYDSRGSRDQHDRRFQTGDPYIGARDPPQSAAYPPQTPRMDYPTGVQPSTAPPGRPYQVDSVYPDYSTVLRPGDPGSNYKYRSSDISNPGDPYARQPAYGMLGGREPARVDPRDARPYPAGSIQYDAAPAGRPYAGFSRMDSLLDERPSEDLRDPYRREPPREERRRGDREGAYRMEQPRQIPDELRYIAPSRGGRDVIMDDYEPALPTQPNRGYGGPSGSGYGPSHPDGPFESPYERPSEDNQNPNRRRPPREERRR